MIIKSIYITLSFSGKTGPFQAANGVNMPQKQRHPSFFRSFSVGWCLRHPTFDQVVKPRLTISTLLLPALLSAYTLASAQQVKVPHAQPVKYIENKNQWPEQVLFSAETGGQKVYLEKHAFTFDLVDVDHLRSALHAHKGPSQQPADPIYIQRHTYQLQFLGARDEVQVTQNGRSREYYNYLLGNDPQHWGTKAYGYTDITYHALYPDIDLHVYSSGTNIKYDLILEPGADPADIQLFYAGAEVLLNEQGQLLIVTAVDTLREMRPYAYQKIQGQIVPVECHYVVDGNQVYFDLPRGYNKNIELIIDPELVFGSYSGSSADNWGYTATYDDDGNLYGGGIVFGSGYPTTVGAYTTTYQGGTTDIGISKFTPDGTDLIYSTYLGGNSSELPHSLMATSGSALVIYGTTGSADFPITPGAYDNSFNGGTFAVVDGIISFNSGIDIYVAKLSADGTTLLASTYIGGTDNDGMNLASGFTTQYNYGDFVRGEVILDASENIYVASSTTSDDFPTTPGVFQPALSGDQEGVVFKFNSTLSTLTWSSYIGGDQEDGAYSMKLNSLNELIVGGGTASSDFPVTAGVWDNTYSGGVTDGWVARIAADGSSLIACTFAGTNNYDQVYFVETDDADNVYITGQTRGTWTVTAGVYEETNGRQFITKLEPDLSAVIYSTRFGSGGSAVNISPSAFLVDDCENVYVSGWGGTVNTGYNVATGFTTGMTITADALQTTTDGNDFYFFVVSKDAIDLLFASYFGGPSSPEHVDGGTSRFDKEGAIYQAVCAGCWGLDDFPTTAGAWSEVNGSALCNLGVAKINMNVAGVYAAAVADPSFIGCAPFDVNFINTSADAEDYIWDFGDGSPLNYSFEPSHTYVDPGTYEVMLVVIDSTTCNIADTAYLTVEVLTDSIDATFDALYDEDCDSLVVTLNTLGTFLPSATFTWDFGDGTTSTEQNPEHVYYDPGAYTITLIVEDPTSCNGLDTFELTINYLYEFNSGFEYTAVGCLPIEATFSSNFTEGDDYIWLFGDGTTGSGQDTSHVYTEPGTYTVSLITVNCGIPDTVSQIVVIDGLPEAYFDDYPERVIMNTLVEFTNLSTNAVTYLWDFGDGGTSTDVNGQHIYTELGTYTVCLTATNSNGCSDIYCRQVIVEASGAVGVPNAFTPNGDGVNDILIVKGFGFADMQFLVFNRWGELVFQTDDPRIGWDGSYRGREQEMEVYVYVLQGNFADGNTFDLKGNVTLLR